MHIRCFWTSVSSLVRNPGLLGALVGVVLAFGPVGAEASILKTVQDRGSVNCGISGDLLGFSLKDDAGEWKGLDIDVCRAVAAAVFGDASKVEPVVVTGRDRFTKLGSGDIDILVRNTTWTLVRDTTEKANFVGINFYDGQAFMVRRAEGVSSAADLSGASVCVEAGTTTELNMVDYFRLNRMDFNPVVLADQSEILATYNEGRCDVYTTDASALAAQIASTNGGAEHMILPDIISKEPLGPSVRHGDDQWADIVRWSLNAMLAAEEWGVTSENVDDLKQNAATPAILRLLGVSGDLGAGMGLSADWAYNIIKQVGNYSESYERNVGKKSALGLERGLNALYKDGGLMYPIPFR